MEGSSSSNLEMLLAVPSASGNSSMSSGGKQKSRSSTPKEPSKKKPKQDSRKRKEIKVILSDDALSRATQEAQREEERRLRRVEYGSAAGAASTSATKPAVLITLSDDDDEELDESIAEDEPSSDASYRRPDGRVILNARRKRSEEEVFVSDRLAPYIKPHQICGVRFMYANVIERANDFANRTGFGCILAHSMGLGKTLQVVALLEAALRVTAARRALVLAPVNALQHWAAEFARWLPSSSANPSSSTPFAASAANDAPVTVHTVNETARTLPARYAVVADWFKEGGVLLMGYEMFRRLTSGRFANKARRKQSSRKHRPPLDEPEEVVDIEENELHESLAQKMRHALVDPGPDIIVCDEGHRIKNLNAVTTKSLEAVRTRRRIVLTGYPLQNNLIEYYCMVNFVRPNYLGTRKEFSNMFDRPIANGQCNDSTAKDRKLARQRTHVLIIKLRGFVQRRSQALLKGILPTCTEMVLLFRKSPIQFELYRRFVNFCRTSSEAEEGGLCNPLKVFAACCKIWNHPDIIYQLLSKKNLLLENDLDLEQAAERANASTNMDKNNPIERALAAAEQGMLLASTAEQGGDEFPPATAEDSNNTVLFRTHGALNYEWARDCMRGYVEGVVENGYKVAVTMEILREAISVGDKVLIFSQSLFTLGLLEDYLKKFPMEMAGQPVEWRRNRNYFRLDGSTNAMERERLISRFNNEVAILVFLISTRAGSLGINLAAANRVIIFDASWNPCHDAQAVCRVYRYGQRKPIYIYRLVADNSMERAIFNRQISKRAMSTRIVDAKTGDHTVTRQEIQNLLQYDEHQDTLAWTIPDDWTSPDAILNRICRQYTHMFAGAPLYHDSLVAEADEQLTEEEKVEAEMQYEQEKRLEKQLNMPRSSSDLGFMLPRPNADYDFNLSRTDPRQDPRFRIAGPRAYFDGRGGLEAKPTAAVRPQLAAQHLPANMTMRFAQQPTTSRMHDYPQAYPGYDSNYRQIAPRPTYMHGGYAPGLMRPGYEAPSFSHPPTQAMLHYRPPTWGQPASAPPTPPVGADTPGAQLSNVQLTEPLELPSITYPGSWLSLHAGQSAMVVKTARGIYLRLPDGNVLDARGSIFDHETTPPEPSEIIELNDSSDGD